MHLYTLCAQVILASSSFFLKLPEFAAMEQANDDPQAPDIEDIVVAKNKEDYLVNPEDDWQEMTRPVVNLFECPFSPCLHPETGKEFERCSKQCWNAANVWSLDGTNKCLGYLMHHGMYSPWHGMSRQVCYDTIISKWKELSLIHISEPTRPY